MNKETKLFYDYTMLYIERRNELTRFLQRNNIFYLFEGESNSNRLMALCNADEQLKITEFAEAI